MMTEWGGDGCGGSDDEQAECSYVQKLADLHLQSWTVWGTNGKTQRESDVLARTYAQAVSGRVVNMTFDAVSHVFDFCFDMDTSIVEPTIIYIAAERFYSHAPVITTTPNINAHVK